MKNRLLLLLLSIILKTAAIAQKPPTYAAVVSFNSTCCGVPGNGPLIALINSFKKQNRIKHISADSIGPMGREGEYYLAFRLTELNRPQKTKFIRLLKKTAATMHDKGSADIKENLTVDMAALSPGATLTKKIL